MLTKFIAGKFKVPVRMTETEKRIYLEFPYNKTLLAEVKSMAGRRWHGYDDPNPRKVWSVKDCPRNRFQIDYLQGNNPYKWYEEELKSVKKNREKLYEHQLEMKAHGLTRKQCILACEMGSGKTLAAIEIMEDSGINDWLWLGSRSSLAAVELEFDIWDAKIIPIFMTYEGVRNRIREENMFTPLALVGDECTKVKTPTAQRSQAVYILAEEMRKVYDKPYIILMSGAPAPKSPADWWHQCEIACPGFLKEGDIHKFRERLALIREEESITGGVYPKLITWLDDKNKCKHCGRLKKEHGDLVMNEDTHSWEESKDEVSFLYERMKGLVLVKFKKDCLDLPEKQFRKIICEPTNLIKKAQQLLKKTTPRAVTLIMKLRELSDGFQYKEEPTGNKTQCYLCKGVGKYKEYYDPEYPDEAPSPEALEQGKLKTRKSKCTICDGTGKVEELKRTASEIECPKDNVFINLLDEHESIGRFVTYAGFQASVNKLVRIAAKHKWDIIQADGRGWQYYESGDPINMDRKEMLKRFQTNYESKIVFIGQAGAAGMGLTLTASPSCFFYSNSFNAEDRIQAMDRIHRPGMDVNRGATIIDCIHLDSDQYILDNLNEKFDLMHMTMGKMRDTFMKEAKYDSSYR